MISSSPSRRCLHAQIERSGSNGSAKNVRPRAGKQGFAVKNSQGEVFEDYGAQASESWSEMPEKPQEVMILKVPKPLPGVSGWKNDSVQGGKF